MHSSRDGTLRDAAAALRYPSRCTPQVWARVSGDESQRAGAYMTGRAMWAAGAAEGCGGAVNSRSPAMASRLSLPYYLAHAFARGQDEAERAAHRVVADCHRPYH